ncbi:MAG: penicillin-binding protein 2 [Actinomycetota bacterium]|nr:penicillin-binding protein 2 [Actinomycetota bacterium]
MDRSYSIKRRVAALLSIILVGFLCISIRLFYIQAISAAKYNKEAEEQRLCSIKIPPNRGIIRDRNGSELAVNTVLDTIYATPYLVEDREKFAKIVAPVLKVDERDILNKLTKQANFAYIARKVDPATARKVKKLVKDNKIKGIGFLKESKRYYPFGRTCSHIVGFSGMDNQGLSGIELFYNKLLYGKPGRIVAERDAYGRPIPRSIMSSYKPVDGADIILTIDQNIQYKAEVELKKAIKKYKAKAGSVIVMNPESGEIYAMANVPDYDPNNLDSITDDNQRNRAVTDLYEPGSTMKTVIAAAALEEGLCSPSTTFFLEPVIRVGSKTIKEAHARPARNFSFSQILQQSSNVGIVKVGMLLGQSKIVKYLEKFGFNKKSGIDFPGEAEGYYPQADRWSKVAMANIPFGQGICTTQLAMTKAYAIIANDGVPIKPHLLINARGKREKLASASESKPEERILGPRTCAQIREILEKAVLDGTGTQAKVPNYSVGGKTGTAQKARVNGRGYEKGKYIASFIGMAPIRNPKLVISVVIDEPKGSIYGASVAAPVFSKIAEFSLRYLKIPPDQGPETRDQKPETGN